MFSPRAQTKLISRPATRNGSTCRMDSKEAPPTPPICQERTPSAMSLRGSTTALMKEARAAAVAAPASASLSGVAPSRPREAIRYTPAAVIVAPMIATQM